MKYGMRCLFPAGLLFLALSCAAGVTAAHASPAKAELVPFGSGLFQGNFSQSAAQAREIRQGDRILLRFWGGLSLDATFEVSPKGEIELPELGPMTVAGLRENQLGDAVRSKLNAAGWESTQFYSLLLNAQPITVVVAGSVKKPGSYAGAASDSILAFLDRAGGVDPRRGSYRNISLLREGAAIAAFDLYPFALSGEIAPMRLQNGDTLVVREKGISVSAFGESRNAAVFELRQGESKGENLMALAQPLAVASHVSLTGTRDNAPVNLYLSLRDFRATPLADGDSIRFLADVQGDTIMVEVTGAIKGVSRFPLRKGARLSELRRFIAVEPLRADLEGLYVKRKSVAVRQKKAIDEALRRLEQSSMTAVSSSPEEAQIRTHEAEMISKFAEKARKAEPEGIVVVGDHGSVADIALEDGDIVVIPEKSDVVMISGEVVIPQAMVWSSKKGIEDYVKGAGGFTNRADSSHILLLRPNGEVDAEGSDVRPGDQVIVLPRVESKNLQAVKDITQIVYQIAVAAKMVIPFSF